MPNPDLCHSSASTHSLPETYFGDVEFHLRNSHVFALDEESDAYSGFKPPTLSAYKQSLTPLHRGTPGRATGRVQATVHTALNEYFARVGWSYSTRPGYPGTPSKNVSGAGQDFSKAA
jgi:hypothetical protein